VLEVEVREWLGGVLVPKQVEHGHADNLFDGESRELVCALVPQLSGLALGVVSGSRIDLGYFLD
jgi:hypothetical protein